ncbi:MAG: hypothetical protein JWN77_2631 [Frankiales bacterium]|jgi:hypothetical protein|nr:hypothetical protein [Frankiales bacterium]
MVDARRASARRNGFVLLKAAAAFVAGAVAFWAITDDWNRALSYASGFTGVLLVLDIIRGYRGRDADLESPPGEEHRPRLFGNG